MCLPRGLVAVGSCIPLIIDSFDPRYRSVFAAALWYDQHCVGCYCFFDLLRSFYRFPRRILLAEARAIVQMMEKMIHQYTDNNLLSRNCFVPLDCTDLPKTIMYKWTSARS